MDPITHAALGASCAQAILGKYNKHIPWSVGALAAMAPDLDIFLRFKDEPLSLELLHRNFTHSLFFIPIGGLFVGLLFLCFSYYRRSWKTTLGAALIGYGTHGVLDALTSYGTMLLWPLSNNRFSWDIIAIVDPIFTIFLILGTFWSVIYRKPKGVLIGLLFAGLILVFNYVQHYRALNTVEDFIKKQKLTLTNIRVMPELASSIYWRVIAKYGSCLLIKEIYNPIYKQSSLDAIAELPLLKDNFSEHLSLEQENDLAIFKWFSDNYVIIAQRAPLILGDGRYIRVDNPLYSLWGIKIDPKKEHVVRLTTILLKEKCSLESQ